MHKPQQTKFSQASWERIVIIHERILSGTYPNASDLAAEMEVSERTILRDIGYMKDRLKRPIEYESRRYGFFYSSPPDQLPIPALSEAEIFALLVAHKAIAQYHGTPFEKPLRLAFEKLTRPLDSKLSYGLPGLDGGVLSFRPFAPEDTDLQSFEIISRALKQSRVLKFQYRNRGTRNSQPRKVHPYHLACINNLWYLFAWDTDRKDLRTFYLTRLTRPELTNASFTRPKDFNPDKILGGSFNVFKGHEHHDILIEFDAWAADEIRDRRWHTTQQLTHLPDGGCQMKLQLNSLEEIVGWVLSYGAHATVLQPKTLADRIRKSAVLVTAKYQRS